MKEFAEVKSKKWIVLESTDDIPGKEKYHPYDKPEDLSIFTVDGDEVIGCSEWMRAERETFDYIINLHNKYLEETNNA